jgi:hypothetical protein
MDTLPDSNSDLEDDDADGNEGGRDLSGDQAQDGGQGEGGADRAGENGALAGDRKKAKVEATEVNKKKYGRPTKIEKKEMIDAITRSIVNGYTKEWGKNVRVNARFKQEFARRVELGRMDALDALHDLACMPITENALLNQVKFMAASKLAGPPQDNVGQPNEIGATLSELHKAFSKTAPRIRAIRERVVEFDEPKVIN